MNNKTPIEKSPQFKPLYSEHQDGLLFVSRLTKGLENNTDIYTLVEYVGWFWKHHIKPHFYQEEKILLPYLPVGHPLAKKLKDDHTEIREHVIKIDQDAERYDLVCLCNFIKAHIQWEEQEYFKYLALHLSERELNEIDARLNTDPIYSSNNWTDAFWEASMESHH